MKIKEQHFIVLILSIVLPVICIIMMPINLGLDLKGGTSVVLQAEEEKGTKINNDTMAKVRNIIQRRIDGLGVSEPVIQQSGENRLIVELAGIKDPEKAVALIGTTAKLEFKIKNPDGSYGETVLDGSAIKSAYVETSGLSPRVGFELTPEGGEKFAQITRENTDKQLAIILDGKEQSAPMIKEEISGGKGSISGQFTIEQAEDLSNLLKSGALPVNIKILETRTVDASLGAESIAATKTAGIVALCFIFAFMLIIYRFAGIVANVALALFALLTAGTLALIGSTLTLPGIAGFILSLGMAVDANVIIFERIKDGIKEGRGFQKCVDEGFHKALPAILDGNITTLIITIILFFYGTGPVRGFAIILTMGILVSMFTAVFVTKIILQLFINTFHFKGGKLFGMKGAE